MAYLFLGSHPRLTMAESESAFQGTGRWVPASAGEHISIVTVSEVL